MKSISTLVLFIAFTQSVHAVYRAPEEFRAERISFQGAEYADIRISTIAKGDDDCNPTSLIGSIYELTPPPDRGESINTYLFDVYPFHYSRGCPGPLPKFDREVVYTIKKQLPRLHRKCSDGSRIIWLPKYYELEVILGPATCMP